MNDLCQSAAEVDVSIRLKILQILPAKALCHDETEDWSPSLTTTVEQVIRRVVQALIDSIDIGKMVGSVASYLTTTRTILQHGGVRSLKVISLGDLTG